MTTRAHGDAPDDFAHATESLLRARLRPQVRLDEIPAPQRIAPHAYALTADVTAAPGEDPAATGRFVVLHDPASPDAWEGAWRVVTFASAALEPEVAADPVLGEVGWSWLTDALAAQDAEVSALGGTVTRVVSESFAGLAAREAGVEMEIRASWTPASPDLAPHLRAWADLLCTLGGLPPLPEGVAALAARRR